MYNIEQMIEDGGIKHINGRGEWVVYLPQVTVGFAEFNIERQRYNRYGLDVSTREELRKYKVN